MSKSFPTAPCACVSNTQTEAYRNALGSLPLEFLELSLTSRPATLSQPAASPANAYLVNDLLLAAKAGSKFGGVALAAQAGVRLPPPLLRTSPLFQGAS